MRPAVFQLPLKMAVSDEALRATVQFEVIQSNIEAYQKNTTH
jgi:hypothetical protein